MANKVKVKPTTAWAVIGKVGLFVSSLSYSRQVSIAKYLSRRAGDTSWTEHKKQDGVRVVKVTITEAGR